MFIQAILDLFGFSMETSFGFLTKDLETFAPNVAATMETINGGLQAFSYALLVILTLWNVVRTAGSYVELKRPEHVIKLLVRFILSKYAIGMAWTLVNGIFTITGALTAKAFLTSGLTDGNVWAGITAPDFGDDGIMGILSAAMSFLNPLAQIPSLLLGLIGFIVAIVLSVTLLLTVIGRFFKIYFFAALSPIPLACFGSESTQSVGQNFLRAFAGVSLEGFIVGLAMIIFAAYSQAPLIDFGSVGIFQWLGSAADEMAYMYTLIFNMLLLLGIIKGADQVTHRIFGV